ncbi:hypothetical protein [Sphingomonas alpina]|uniref:Uncharacterized protein n=1 Tax=Sphingomonas alpina TaxID=653931 RepID=A0A7H0LPR8_9SPHN|nr:hypothetical protein [Sphingomonas alpina]QNQ11671.1 hypothetical protein H3Z74_11355 [Sphingomonas alpina]
MSVIYSKSGTWVGQAAVRDIFSTSVTICSAIQFAKSPARIAKIEDRWTLEVTFIPERDLQIQAVDIEDTQLIID